MVRNYLKKYADRKLLRELRGVLETFGAPREYVDVCLRGVIRSAQAEIYALFTVFDIDDFRLDHMCAKRVGIATKASEEYWERASEANTWRAVIDVETLKIVAAARQALSTMQERATNLCRHQFVVHPDYAVFVEPVQAGKRKLRAD